MKDQEKNRGEEVPDRDIADYDFYGRLPGGGITPSRSPEDRSPEKTKRTESETKEREKTT